MTDPSVTAAVDWSALEHAYGPATDVPARIERLRNPSDQQAAADAEHELWASVVHQGNIYSATAPALRLILPLLADPDHPQSGAIAEWLATIVHIFDNANLHPDVVATRQVVLDHWPILRTLLDRSAPDERAAVAGVVSHLTALDRPVLDALAERWATETDDLVRADVLVSAAVVAGRLGAPGEVRPWIDRFGDDPDPFRRCAAAVAWSVLESAATTPVDQLLALLPDPGLPGSYWWGVGQPQLIVERWAEQVNRPVQPDLPVLMATLAREDPRMFSAGRMLRLLLARVFPAGRRGLPALAVDLDADQRAVIEALAATPRVFPVVGRVHPQTSSEMSHLHLPPDAPSLRRWLGGAARVDCVALGIRQILERS